MQGIIKATLLLLSFSSLACSQIEGHSKWSDLFLIFCGWQINDTQSKRCWADMLYLIGCKRVQYDIWRHDNADWRLVQMHFFWEGSQSSSDDWCKDFEPFFVSNCPASIDSYTGWTSSYCKDVYLLNSIYWFKEPGVQFEIWIKGCCLCTQYYYYSCSCCKDIVDQFGVGGDVS